MKMFATKLRIIKTLQTSKVWLLGNNKFYLLPTNQLGITIRFKHSNAVSSTSSTGHSLRLLWNNVFGKYLLLTNIVGSGVLMVIGDVMAQEIEIRKVKGDFKGVRYDVERIGRMFVAGALLGPLHHYVYNWMDKVWPIPTVKNTLQKILIDELFMSPACILIFFYSACLLERKSLKETNDELRAKFLFIYCVDWLLWPAAQYFNFRHLDLKYRVTFVNICTAFYNVFMSYMKHNHDWDV